MVGADALFTTAEIGVAFAGFASVVTVFRRQDDGGWIEADIIRFQLMIWTSLSVVLFAMLPFAFDFFGTDEPTTWASCSAVFAVFVSVVSYRSVRASVSAVVPGGISPFVMWASLLVAAAAIVLQILNATGIYFRHELGPYYAGLLCLLIISGVSFARLLPVGRAGER